MDNAPVVVMPLLEFGLKYFKHYFTNQMPDFHREMVEDIEALKPGDCECWIAPRGSAKSTWVTKINPIHKAAHRLKMYILLFGDTQPNANIFLSQIRTEIESNEELRNDYPHCREGSTWATEAIELSNGVRIEALCYGKGKVRGRKNKQYRPDLVVIDDPQSAEDAYSPTQLERDEQWLKSDIMEAGGPETNYLAVGTNIADGSLVSRIKSLPTWKHRTYKSLITPPTNWHLWLKWWDDFLNDDSGERKENAYARYLQNKEAMDAGAKVLWEDRVPLYQLMLKRFSQGERAFMSEHQGEPMPPGDAEWPMEYFDWPGFWFDEWPTDVTLSAFALDPSKGRDSNQGDYQALGRGVMSRNGTVYIEAWLEKMDSQSLMDFAVDRWSETPAEAFALETNCFQELLKIPLATSVKNKNALMKLPLVELINTVKKEVRIRRHTPYLASRKYRFRNTPGTRLLVEQLKKFPFAEHDDGPDMMEMLIRTLIQLSHVKR